MNGRQSNWSLAMSSDCFEKGGLFFKPSDEGCFLVLIAEERSHMGIVVSDMKGGSMREELVHTIQGRITYLKNIVKDQEARLKHAPKYYLKVCQTAERTQYYLRKSGADSVGKYLRKDQIDLAGRIAQRDYDELVRQAAEEEIEFLLQILEMYPEACAEEIYAGLHPARKKLVMSRFQTNEEYAEEWKNRELETKEFFTIGTEFITEAGERVRSKSELMIANALRHDEVPYFYEPALWVNGQKFHPDFMVLNVRTRQEFYWEHLGMLDNEEYMDTVMSRLNEYEKAGIYVGERLLLTRESSAQPLSSLKVRQMIEHYLL